MIRRHLLAVWNPSYTTDAMDAHVAVLRERIAAARSAGGDPADIYVWWGRVRSPNRQERLPHLAEVLALDEESPDDDSDAAEMHLYLTDYRSLYVGQVAAITAEDVATTEPDHVPAYYRTAGLKCDCWFQLWDIRRLVQDDTVAVVEALRRLRNTHYYDRPVSLYGGMVNLPLVVTRDDDVRYFDAAERERLLDGRYWVEFDADQAGFGPLERELRDNLFGEAAWSALDAGSRAFILTAERVLRDNRPNAGFDFGPVMTAFGKVLELETNRRLRAGLRAAPRDARLAHVDRETLDLTACRPLSLGELAHVLSAEAALTRHLRQSLAAGAWFTGQLPAILDEFRDVRNAGSHQRMVDRATAIRWRNRLVGVGVQGDLVQLAQVVPR